MTLIDPDNSDNFDYLQTTWHYPMDITHIIYTHTYDNPDISYRYCSRDIHSYDNPDNPDNPDNHVCLYRHSESLLKTAFGAVQ